MKRYRSFYIPDSSVDYKSIDRIVLEKDESHHLISVLRVSKGDIVSVFDGFGSQWMCVFDGVTTGKAVLEVRDYKFFEKSKSQVTLLQAIPKGKAMEQIVRQATEIGVSRIVPLITKRTEVKLDEKRSDSKIERWRQIAIEASKQSNNIYVPVIEPISFFDDFITKYNQEGAKLIASLQANAQPLHGVGDIKEVKEVSCLIGPEGDFTEQEYELAHMNGFKPLRLTSNILRVETATIYTLGIINYILY